MSSTLQRLQDALGRMTHVFAKRPAAAQGSGRMQVRVIDGYHCEAREGDWRYDIDMPVDFGGTGLGPSPGVHGRAALASCLAIGLSMELAREGVVARSIEVDVECDFDVRGLIGPDDINPGYTAVRYTIHVDCDLPAAQVEAIVERVKQRSPYMHVFGDPQPLTGRLVLGPRA